MPATRRSTRLKAIALGMRSMNLVNLSSTLWHSPENDLASRRNLSGKKSTMPAGSNTSPSANRKRLGKLGNLLILPLDILFEILSHLLPYDLLRLARTVKPLRQLLMSRSSSLAWKQARVNVPGPSFPECPVELSEPAYAHLVFDNHCHFCGVQGASQVEWALFTRACKTCDEHEYLKCYHSAALSELCDELAIIPSQAITDIDCLTPISRHKYVPAKLRPVLLEYAALESEEQREEWKRTKREQKRQRAAFAAEITLWVNNRSHQRRHEIKDAKDRRRTAILDRLKKEGWADVVDNLDERDLSEFNKHRMVKQNKVLTDRIWAVVQPEIILLFNTFRARHQHRRIVNTLSRRLDMFETAFGRYCSSLPPGAIVAPLKTILSMNPILDVIYNTDMNMIPTESAFMDIFTAIPELTTSWRADFDRYLWQLLTQSLATSGPLEASNLHSATSLFCCTTCGDCHLSHQQTLSHSCLHKGLPVMTTHFGLSAFVMPLHNFIHLPSNGEFTICPHKGRMEALLELCNLPENTMMAALIEINPLIEAPISTCKASLEDSGFCAMYWHEMLSHDEVPIESMRVLDYADLTGIMLRPTAHWFQLGALTRRIYGCRHCYTPRALNFEALQEHLMKRHEIHIETRESMEHYIIHPGAPATEASYGLLCAEPP